jgi:uncharacterized protein
MNLELEDELIQIVESDKWMIKILKIVRNLDLNDCWVGAGFARNKIWDIKHGKKVRTKLNDIDVIYFDKSKLSKENDLQIENELNKLNLNLKWSVKNQARMHLRNGQNKYKNCNHAISFWPETATSIAIRLNSNNKVEHIAPHGLNDLFNLLVKPTPKFNLNIYNSRVESKRWKEIWNKLKIING